MRGDDGECATCPKCPACVEIRETGETLQLHSCGDASSFAAEADTIATKAPIPRFSKAS